MLLKLVAEHKLPAEKFVTHQFSFDQMLEAYESSDTLRNTTRSRSSSIRGGQAMSHPVRRPAGPPGLPPGAGNQACSPHDVATRGRRVAGKGQVRGA